MNANTTLLQKKYSRVIQLYAKKYDVPVETALRRFYHSCLYRLISEGVSDLHCMSDDYLADELKEEWSESVFYNTFFILPIKKNRITVRFSSHTELILHVSSVIILDEKDQNIVNGMRKSELIRISERQNVDGMNYADAHFDFCKDRYPKWLLFIVRDKNHQEQHSIAICLSDQKVYAKKMVYDVIGEPYNYTEWCNKNEGEVNIERRGVCE